MFLSFAVSLFKLIAPEAGAPGVTFYSFAIQSALQLAAQPIIPPDRLWRPVNPNVLFRGFILREL